MTVYVHPSMPLSEAAALAVKLNGRLTHDEQFNVVIKRRTLMDRLSYMRRVIRDLKETS